MELEAALNQYTDLYDFAPVGYFTLAKNGEILKVNLNGALALGIERAVLMKHHFGQYVTDESRNDFNFLLQKVYASQAKETCEVMLLKMDHDPFWVQLEAICSKDGEAVQLALVDITERKEAEETIRNYAADIEQHVVERTAELIRANRVKDEFLASMSHELRTPLTSILGLSEVLQLKVYGELDDKQYKMIKSIEESGHHLLDLINDILDLSKIEAGKFEIQFGAYSLHEICQASLQLIKGMAQHKSQHVQYSPPTESIIVDVDARLFKQLLVNLLSNAIKFTPENGELGLEIQTNKSERKFKVIVWDKGIGIKTEDLPKLFKPFTQLDSSLSREYSGTGLGLSLVQHLTEMHKGSIEVESKFGQGSRFTVTLPWSPQNTTPIPKVLQHGTGPLLSPATSGEYSKAPLVLFADDNKMVLQMVADFLEAIQYRVITVQSGLQLLEQAVEFHPDIMLVDIQMPGIDGLETIRRIRSHVDLQIAETPVIAVTALAMPADRERCLLAGANEYMSKPLKFKELTTTIQKLLERKP